MSFVEPLKRTKLKVLQHSKKCKIFSQYVLLAEQHALVFCFTINLFFKSWQVAKSYKQELKATLSCGQDLSRLYVLCHPCHTPTRSYIVSFAICFQDFSNLKLLKHDVTRVTCPNYPILQSISISPIVAYSVSGVVLSWY